ncbi:MAG: hypothetical protein AAB225_12865 [Acidobacteriota bacterium]
MRPSAPARLLFAAALLAAGGRLAAQQELTFHARLDTHLQCLISPRGLLLSGAAAGINQWRDHPWEWGQGAAGYGRRYAYRNARHGARHGIELPVGALLGEDPRYHRSGERGFWKRTRYAIAHTIIARGRDGKDHFASARLASLYGSAFLANTWYPDRLNTTRHALARGTISVGWGVAENVFDEFWPDIKRKLFGRRQ